MDAEFQSTRLSHFCPSPQFLEIEYLPVYYPSEDEKKNAFLYAENVRKVRQKVEEHIRPLIRPLPSLCR